MDVGEFSQSRNKKIKVPHRRLINRDQFAVSRKSQLQEKDKSKRRMHTASDLSKYSKRGDSDNLLGITDENTSNNDQQVSWKNIVKKVRLQQQLVCGEDDSLSTFGNPVPLFGQLGSFFGKSTPVGPFGLLEVSKESIANTVDKFDFGAITEDTGNDLETEIKTHQSLEEDNQRINEKHVIKECKRFVGDGVDETPIKSGQFETDFPNSRTDNHKDQTKNNICDGNDNHLFSESGIVASEQNICEQTYDELGSGYAEDWNVSLQDKDLSKEYQEEYEAFANTETASDSSTLSKEFEVALHGNDGEVSGVSKVSNGEMDDRDNIQYEGDGGSIADPILKLIESVSAMEGDPVEVDVGMEVLPGYNQEKEDAEGEVVSVAESNLKDKTSHCTQNVNFLEDSSVSKEVHSVLSEDTHDVTPVSEEFGERNNISGTSENEGTEPYKDGSRTPENENINGEEENIVGVERSVVRNRDENDESRDVIALEVIEADSSTETNHSETKDACKDKAKQVKTDSIVNIEKRSDNGPKDVTETVTACDKDTPCDKDGPTEMTHSDSGAIEVEQVLSQAMVEKPKELNLTGMSNHKANPNNLPWTSNYDHVDKGIPEVDDEMILQASKPTACSDIYKANTPETHLRSLSSSIVEGGGRGVGDKDSEKEKDTNMAPVTQLTPTKGLFTTDQLSNIDLQAKKGVMVQLDSEKMWGTGVHGRSSDQNKNISLTPTETSAADLSIMNNLYAADTGNLQEKDTLLSESGTNAIEDQNVDSTKSGTGEGSKEGRDLHPVEQNLSESSGEDEDAALKCLPNKTTLSKDELEEIAVVALGELVTTSSSLSEIANISLGCTHSNTGLNQSSGEDQLTNSWSSMATPTFKSNTQAPMLNVSPQENQQVSELVQVVNDLFSSHPYAGMAENVNISALFSSSKDSGSLFDSLQKTPPSGSSAESRKLVTPPKIPSTSTPLVSVISPALLEDRMQTTDLNPSVMARLMESFPSDSGNSPGTSRTNIKFLINETKGGNPNQNGCDTYSLPVENSFGDSDNNFQVNLKSIKDSVPSSPLSGQKSLGEISTQVCDEDFGHVATYICEEDGELAQILHITETGDSIVCNTNCGAKTAFPHHFQDANQLQDTNSESVVLEGDQARGDVHEVDPCKSLSISDSSSKMTAETPRRKLGRRHAVKKQVCTCADCVEDNDTALTREKSKRGEGSDVGSSSSGKEISMEAEMVPYIAMEVEVMNEGQSQDQERVFVPPLIVNDDTRDVGWSTCAESGDEVTHRPGSKNDKFDKGIAKKKSLKMGVPKSRVKSKKDDEKKGMQSNASRKIKQKPKKSAKARKSSKTVTKTSPGRLFTNISEEEEVKNAAEALTTLFSSDELERPTQIIQTAKPEQNLITMNDSVNRSSNTAHSDVSQKAVGDGLTGTSEPEANTDENHKAAKVNKDVQREQSRKECKTKTGTLSVLNTDEEKNHLKKNKMKKKKKKKEKEKNRSKVKRETKTNSASHLTDDNNSSEKAAIDDEGQAHILLKKSRFQKEGAVEQSKADTKLLLNAKKGKMKTQGVIDYLAVKSSQRDKGKASIFTKVMPSVLEPAKRPVELSKGQKQACSSSLSPVHVDKDVASHKLSKKDGEEIWKSSSIDGGTFEDVKEQRIALEENYLQRQTAEDCPRSDENNDDEDANCEAKIPPSPLQHLLFEVKLLKEASCSGEEQQENSSLPITYLQATQENSESEQLDGVIKKKCSVVEEPLQVRKTNSEEVEERIASLSEKLEEAIEASQDEAKSDNNNMEDTDTDQRPRVDDGCYEFFAGEEEKKILKESCSDPTDLARNKAANQLEDVVSPSLMRKYQQIRQISEKSRARRMKKFQQISQRKNREAEMVDEHEESHSVGTHLLSDDRQKSNETGMNILDKEDDEDGGLEVAKTKQDECSPSSSKVTDSPEQNISEGDTRRIENEDVEVGHRRKSLGLAESVDLEKASETMSLMEKAVSSGHGENCTQIMHSMEPLSGPPLDTTPVTDNSDQSDNSDASHVFGLERKVNRSDTGIGEVLADNFNSSGNDLNSFDTIHGEGSSFALNTVMEMESTRQEASSCERERATQRIVEEDIESNKQYTSPSSKAKDPKMDDCKAVGLEALSKRDFVEVQRNSKFKGKTSGQVRPLLLLSRKERFRLRKVRPDTMNSDTEDDELHKKMHRTTTLRRRNHQRSNQNAKSGTDGVTKAENVVVSDADMAEMKEKNLKVVLSDCRRQSQTSSPERKTPYSKLKSDTYGAVVNVSPSSSVNKYMSGSKSRSSNLQNIRTARIKSADPKAYGSRNSPSSQDELHHSVPPVPSSKKWTDKIKRSLPHSEQIVRSDEGPTLKYPPFLRSPKRGIHQKKRKILDEEKDWDGDSECSEAEPSQKRLRGAAAKLFCLKEEVADKNGKQLQRQFQGHVARKPEEQMERTELVEDMSGIPSSEKVLVIDEVDWMKEDVSKRTANEDGGKRKERQKNDEEKASHSIPVTEECTLIHTGSAFLVSSDGEAFGNRLHIVESGEDMKSKKAGLTGEQSKAGDDLVTAPNILVDARVINENHLKEASEEEYQGNPEMGGCCNGGKVLPVELEVNGTRTKPVSAEEGTGEGEDCEAMIEKQEPHFLEVPCDTPTEERISTVSQVDICIQPVVNANSLDPKLSCSPNKDLNSAGPPEVVVILPKDSSTTMPMYGSLDRKNNKCSEKHLTKAEELSTSMRLKRCAVVLNRLDRAILARKLPVNQLNFGDRKQTSARGIGTHLVNESLNCKDPVDNLGKEQTDADKRPSLDTHGNLSGIGEEQRQRRTKENKRRKKKKRNDRNDGSLGSGQDEAYPDNESGKYANTEAAEEWQRKEKDHSCNENEDLVDFGINNDLFQQQEEDGDILSSGRDESDATCDTGEDDDSMALKIEAELSDDKAPKMDICSTDVLKRQLTLIESDVEDLDYTDGADSYGEQDEDEGDLVGGSESRHLTAESRGTGEVEDRTGTTFMGTNKTMSPKKDCYVSLQPLDSSVLQEVLQPASDSPTVDLGASSPPSEPGPSRKRKRKDKTHVKRRRKLSSSLVVIDCSESNLEEGKATGGEQQENDGSSRDSYQSDDNTKGERYNQVDTSSREKRLPTSQKKDETVERKAEPPRESRTLEKDVLDFGGHDDAVPDEDCLSIQADSPDFFNDFGDMWEAAEIQNSPEGIEKKDDLECENVSSDDQMNTSAPDECLKDSPKRSQPNVPGELLPVKLMPKIPKKSSKLISDQAKRLFVHEKESSPPPVTRKLLPNLAFIEFDNVSHPGMPLPTATSEHATGLNGNQKLAAANSGTTSKQASEAGWQLTDINKQVHKIPSGYCFQFAELGKCRYRMGCKFKHVLLKNIPVVEKADVNPSTSRGGLLPQPVPLLQKKLDTPIGVTEEMKRSIAAISPLLPSPEPHEPLGRHQRDPMETFHPLPQPAIDAIQQCSSESSTLQHKLKRRDEENLRDRAQTEEDSGSPKGKNWQVSEKEKDDVNKVQRNQNSVRNEANADEGFTETSSSGIFDKKYRLVRNNKVNQTDSEEAIGASDPFLEVRRLLKKRRTSDAWNVYRLKVQQDGFPPKLELVKDIISSFPESVSAFKWKDCKEALIEMGRCFEIDTTHQTLKILQQLSNFHEQEVESEDDLLSVAVNIFKDCVPRQQTTQEDTYLLSKLSDQLFQESHWALLSIFVYKQLDKGFMPSLSSLENVIFKYHALNNHNEDLMKLMRKVDEINMQLPVHIYDRVKKCLELSPYPEDCLVILQMKGRFHPLDPIEQSLAVSQSSDPNLQPSLLSVDDNLPEDCNDGGPLSQRNDPPSFYNGTRKAISVTIQKAKDIETLAKIFLTIYERDRIYLSEEPIQTCLSFGIIRISPSKPHLVYRDFVAYIQGDQALDHDGVIYLVSVGREIFMDRWRRKQIDVCCHILETLSQMDYDVILTVFVNLSTEKMCGRSPFNSLSCLVECCLRTKTTYMAYKLLLALQNNEWDHTFWDKTTKALAWQQHYEELANQLIMAGHLEECLQLLVRMGKSLCRTRKTPKGRRLTKEAFNSLLARAYERGEVALINRVVPATREFSTLSNEHIHRLVTELVMKRDEESLKEARQIYLEGLEEGTYIRHLIRDDLHEGRIQATCSSGEIYIILCEFFFQSDIYLNKLFATSKNRGEICNIFTLRDADICFRILITAVGTHLESSNIQETEMALDSTILKAVEQLGLLIPDFDTHVETLSLQEKVIIMKMDDIKRWYLSNHPKYRRGGRGGGGRGGGGRQRGGVSSR